MARAALTVQAVADRLSAVAAKTVYRLSQQGVLPGFKVAGAWRFQPEDIDRWVAERKALAARAGGAGR